MYPVIFKSNPYIFFTNPVIIGTNSVVFGTNPVVFRKNPFIFRSNPVLFRTNLVICRTNPVIFRTNPVIIRLNSVEFTRKSPYSVVVLFSPGWVFCLGPAFFLQLEGLNFTRCLIYVPYKYKAQGVWEHQILT